ncbi:MAG: glycosyltransferase family 4 protein [Moraxella sp.]
MTYRSWLERHKIFVMSSRFEGLNLSVIEAMAAGCLVIGSDAVGVNELINHETDGLIFPIGDAHVLANHLEAVLKNPSDYQPLTAQARQKVLSYYTKSRMLNDYYDVFTRNYESIND